MVLFLMRNVNFSYRIWSVPESKGLARPTATEADQLNVVSEGCNSRVVSIGFISNPYF